jgi:hypothetical protein
MHTSYINAPVLRFALDMMRNFLFTLLGCVFLALFGHVVIMDAVRRIREESGRIRMSMQILDKDIEHIREEMELFARALHARDEKMRYAEQFIVRQMDPESIIRRMGEGSLERPVAMDDADTKQTLVVHTPHCLTAWEWAWTAMVALVSAYIGMRVERYQ